MAAAKVKVKVLPARAVEVDGRQVVAGEVVSVSRADAEALIREGYAEKAGRGE